PRDMDLPGWRCHALMGAMKGHWAVWVDENWRLIFAFEGADVVRVDYRDYH
nr:type II toxin-antitoxin system RelE/ParE family toxin [Betaproteobacteria bacterium]